MVIDFVAHKTHLKAGVAAPFFEGRDQHGKNISLNDFRSRKLILYFYPKDDTPACTATACSLRDELRHLRQENYAVVGVSADDESSHLKFADKYQLPFPLIADTDMSIIKAYDVWGQKMLFGRIMDGIVRTTFIIDPDGTIERIIDEVNSKHHAQQILGGK